MTDHGHRPADDGDVLAQAKELVEAAGLDRDFIRKSSPPPTVSARVVIAPPADPDDATMLLVECPSSGCPWRQYFDRSHGIASGQSADGSYRFVRVAHELVHECSG